MSTEFKIQLIIGSLMQSYRPGPKAKNLPFGLALLFLNFGLISGPDSGKSLISTDVPIDKFLIFFLGNYQQRFQLCDSSI